MSRKATKTISCALPQAHAEFLERMAAERTMRGQRCRVSDLVRDALTWTYPVPVPDQQRPEKV